MSNAAPASTSDCLVCTGLLIEWVVMRPWSKHHNFQEYHIIKREKNVDFSAQNWVVQTFICGRKDFHIQ